MARRHDLDWIRICAFGLLVLYHVGMYYVTWDWHVKSPFASTTLEPLMFATSPWRLSLLFLVSGAATAFLLEKRPRGFLGARSWRLLLPLAFGMLVIVPPQAYYELLDSRYPGGYHDGYLAFWGRYLAGDDTFCDDDGCLDLPTWNHLWFLAYLWAYTVVTWLAVRLCPARLAVPGDRLGRALSGWGVLLWPALYLILARSALAGVFDSTHALVDDWYNHAQYFAVFVLGFLIARSEQAWEAFRRQRWPALVIAVAGYAFVAWYFGRFGDDNPPPEALRMFQRGVWGLYQWCSIAAILGFASTLAPGDSPARRYLTEAVFPVYLLHQTVIVVLAYNLKPLAMTPAREGPLLVVATFALCFAGFELVRRVAWLRPLFGLGPLRKAAPAAVVAVT